MPYVYRHIRLDKNEPFYIGLSLKDDNSYSRAYSKKRRNVIWNRIVNKSEYKVEILFEDDSPEVIKEKEKEFILLYGRIDLGTGTLCNLTGGGDGSINVIVSEETRRKQSLVSTGRIKSEETLEKMRIANLGEKNPRFGKTMSEEQRAIISSYNKNKIVSEETKKKQSISKRGEKNPNFGKPTANSREVIDTSTGITYTSAGDAVEKLNLEVSSNHLRAMMRGRHKNWTTLIFLEKIKGQENE